ncbi:MAG: HlyD family efflux transporter periplasmic adaptor subunit [Ignavibacteriae bacterium]|nr:MAG: HlyD family efflux transporter periplasmic adaptor subunit [Ignavibacteriota bacterium]
MISNQKLITTPNMAKWIAWMILAALIASILFLAFAPWQQTVSGSGSVTSFAPEARPQTVESVIAGRIVRWYISEGTHVEKGDTICVLADFNVNFFDRGLLAKLENLRNSTFDAQENAIEVAIQRRKQAEQRYNQAIARLDNSVVEVVYARTRYDRADTLFKQKLASRRDLETAQLNLQKSIADSVSWAAALRSAVQDVDAFRADEERVISQAYVAMQEADVRLANAQGRVGAGTITAPISGTVVRIAKAGAGQTVKEGEQLATIVPKTSDQAAEIYIGSMDAALIEPGRLVSLQFSGFPAVQISGWQDIAVGIFHGRVKVIDAVDDGSGRYRVLVVPDGSFKAWPDARFLRQGANVTGWVLLNEVPVGYEIWRQFMGFPPQFPVSQVMTTKSDVPTEKEQK